MLFLVSLNTDLLWFQMVYEAYLSVKVRKVEQNIQIPVVMESNTPEYSIQLNSQGYSFSKLTPRITSLP